MFVLMDAAMVFVILNLHALKIQTAEQKDIQVLFFARTEIYTKNMLLTPARIQGY